MKPIVLNVASALALSFTIAACVPSPDSTPTPEPTRPRPAPSPTPTVAAPSKSNWMDIPATPGDWSYAAQASGGKAMFADAQSGTRFSLTCDRTNSRVVLARSGDSAATVPMILRTEFGDRSLSASPQHASPPQMVASLSAGDSFLDAMALSKGRFAVEIAGLPTLYLPSWGEVTRVVEDCR